MRDFLFLSGEFRVSMPLVFLKGNWDYCGSPSTLCLESQLDPLLSLEGSQHSTHPHYIFKLRRSKYINEKLKGIIFYADMDDKSIEEHNLKTIIASGVPCWPNPHTLLTMINRHNVLGIVNSFGYITHKILQDTHARFRLESMPFPFAVKTGNAHRGLGKYLVTKEEELPVWEGIASIEPFFVGASVRALIIGEEVFGVKVTNSTSWIANSPGGEVEEYALPPELIKHAKLVANRFSLDVAGVDYILEDSGEFHFLEINQYPSLDSSDEIALAAKRFLTKKMDEVEYSSIKA